MEIANAVEPVQDGRIFVELLNGPFLFDHKGSSAEYGADLKLAIDRGWLWKHESGTYVKLPQAGAGLFASLPASFSHLSALVYFLEPAARSTDPRPVRPGHVLTERGWAAIKPERVVRMMDCFRCEDCGWVCENHPERPWLGPHACDCSGAGAPARAAIAPVARC
jgi:hypothetical protein